MPLMGSIGSSSVPWNGRPSTSWLLGPSERHARKIAAPQRARKNPFMPLSHHDVPWVPDHADRRRTLFATMPPSFVERFPGIKGFVQARLGGLLRNEQTAHRQRTEFFRSSTGTAAGWMLRGNLEVSASSCEQRRVHQAPGIAQLTTKQYPPPTPPIIGRPGPSCPGPRHNVNPDMSFNAVHVRRRVCARGD